ncbi:Cytochrome c oxidase assembly protein cox11, mitochondrial [Bulinus truncatus]|nr:Cytochrome c oxidase assembly protein cox11, mitochondrial [Bulinus truncatus]
MVLTGLENLGFSKYRKYHWKYICTGCLHKKDITIFRPLSRNLLASASGKQQANSNKTGLIYIVAIFVFMLGGAYAGVPLYKVFCQTTGLGGQAVKGHDTGKIENMEKVDRKIVVRFNADVAASMRWNFKPQQTEVTVYPGETALAFYTAKNPTDKPIIGISTYNILPYEAGQYFNKIQCFCFEEQRLNPNEQVDMPVFFYIDPEFAEDPKLEHVDSIMLSYTFFESKEGVELPLPGYYQPHKAVAATS